ncbi:MAG: hypothetical protein ACREUT_01705 [Steroidobacteraceae bacterium]
MTNSRPQRLPAALVSILMILALLAPSAAVRAAARCDRACLESYVDRYLDALVAHQPSMVPLAPGVRFTEDGQRLVIGDGLWRTMRAKGRYRLFVTDVPAGQVAFFGSIEEQNRDPTKGSPGIIALRLKVRNLQITEIEQIVVRDEAAGKRVDNMTVNPVYLQAIPASKRMSRAAMIATADKYFSGMQQNDGKGDYPFANDCNRIENGSQATNVPTPPGQKRPDPKTSLSYSSQWSCMEQFKSGLIHFVSRIRDRRYVAVDEERGIVFAFGFFDHEGGTTRTFRVPDGRIVTAGPTQPWTWEIAELFKVEGGKIHKIEAVLHRVPYGMNSGWSTWEQTMSDHARDVTMQ